MGSRMPRWRWLSVFAVANLVCWVSVAVAAGLLIGDGVDLGVETLIRQGQATAIAVWEHTGGRPAPQGQAVAVAGTRAPLPTATEPAQRETSATKTQPQDETTSSTRRVQATAEVIWPPAPTATPPPPRSTPAPTQTLIDSPLLMSNPPISNLVGMNAEMSRSVPGRAVQIRYQEEALNREIGAMLRRNPALPYQDVKVDLRRDGIVVTGRVTVLGFEVKTEAVGTVTAQDCLPQIEIDTISLAGVLTPGFVKNEIKDMILEAMAWYPADYPLCLEQIVLEETGATIYGYRR